MGTVEDIFQEHLEVLGRTGKLLSEEIERAARIVTDCFRQGGKVVLFGNGGSAADAQHIEAELICRFKKDRDGLPAVAVGSGLPAMTAAANDFSYEAALARLVKALVQDGDVALAISTSGESPNVIEAARVASEKGARVIALTGKSGGDLKSCAELTLNVPSTETARIQEAHITIGHILCEIVEKELFGRN